MSNKQAVVRHDIGLGEIVAFSRKFQLWAYSVSHSQLLLRSKRTPDCPTRIDIAFRGVVGMKLPWILDSLEVTIAEQIPGALQREISGLTMDQKQLYSCRSGEFDGWVVASTVSIAEDGEGYDAPSPIFEPWLIGAL